MRSINLRFTYFFYFVGYSLQCPTELHKIDPAAGAPFPQTSLSLGSLWVASDPTLFDAFGDSHSQSLSSQERTDVATTVHQVHC